MNTEKCAEILLELLRVESISIRNLAGISGREAKIDAMLVSWTELCHSVPSILLGRCDSRAVRYFLDGDALSFKRDYPAKQDADYKQAICLLDELRILIKN
jgi:hypothetical protein